MLAVFLVAIPTAIAETSWNQYGPDVCIGQWCPNNGPRWFGPAYSGMNGFGDWESNIPWVAEFSNLIMIGQPLETTNPAEIAEKDTEEINLASQYDAKSLLVLFNVFFEAVYDGSRLADILLRPDYVERWAKYAQIIEPQVKNIYGIITVDEPFLNSLIIGKSIREMRKEINQVNFLIKKTFPSIRTVGIMHTTHANLAGQEFCGFAVPANAAEEFEYPAWDVIGFDFYYSSNLGHYSANPELELEEFKRAWLEKFNSFNEFLIPGQEIILVPGVFYFRDARSPSVEEFLDLANFYYEVAKSNPKVTVVLPFLWESVGNNLAGMRDLPIEILYRWQNIGRRVKNQVF